MTMSDSPARIRSKPSTPRRRYSGLLSSKNVKLHTFEYRSNRWVARTPLWYNHDHATPAKRRGLERPFPHAFALHRPLYRSLHRTGTDGEPRPAYRAVG